MKLAIIGFKDAKDVKNGTVNDFCAQVEVDDSFDWGACIDDNMLDVALSQLIEVDAELRDNLEDVVLMDIV